MRAASETEPPFFFGIQVSTVASSGGDARAAFRAAKAGTLACMGLVRILPLPEGEVARRSRVGEGGTGLSEQIARPPPPQFGADQFECCINVFKHETGWQPERPDTTLRHPLIARGITGHLIVVPMNPAIDLDSQFGAVAVEIENVGSEGVLSSEM